MTQHSISRRQFLVCSAMLASAAMVRPSVAQTTRPVQRYRIAACDWTMLKRQTPGAIKRAAETGCDGVETDMGSLGKNPTFENKFLSEPGFAEKYLADCREKNIEIASLAMSGFYAQNFAEREVDQPVRDCLATMKRLGVARAFLPLGVAGEAKRWPDTRGPIIERLKQVGVWAEEAGVTIGIETALSAEGDCELLDTVGSKAIRIYFNFQNAINAGRDVCDELATLGKDRIMQIHPTSNDVYWLKDDPAIDMPKVKKTLDAMDWSGWLVIERSRHKDHGRDVVLNFSTNAAYLKSIFQA
jgi:L-ribulose-5-phosphate 3-epimerase